MNEMEICNEMKKRELHIKEIEVITSTHIGLANGYICAGKPDLAKDVLDRLNDVLKKALTKEEKGE